MISAIERALTLGDTPETELLARNVDQLEDEIVAMQAIVGIALGALGDNDELRGDLEEIRTAAELALAKIKQFRARASRRPRLRAV
ncbi:MAG TPA: hypothetical protein VIV40_27930 [Kofleriaceae bacterium]